MRRWPSTASCSSPPWGVAAQEHGVRPGLEHYVEVAADHGVGPGRTRAAGVVAFGGDVPAAVEDQHVGSAQVVRESRAGAVGGPWVHLHVVGGGPQAVEQVI